MRAVERSLGSGDVGADNCRADIFQGNPIGGESRKVRLNADRGTDTALNRNMTDARNFGESRRHDGVSHIAQRAQVDALRRQRERDDRRVGGIHLRIKRRIGKVAR
jgi:hypothetical protein